MYIVMINGTIMKYENKEKIPDSHKNPYGKKINNKSESFTMNIKEITKYNGPTPLLLLFFHTVGFRVGHKPKIKFGSQINIYIYIYIILEPVLV